MFWYLVTCGEGSYDIEGPFADVETVSTARDILLRLGTSVVEVFRSREFDAETALNDWMIRRSN